MGKAEKTKAKILIKAIEIVAEKGFASTTTKEISDASGVAEGTLFKYFKSKDNLLYIMLQDLLEKLKVESFDKIEDSVLNQDCSATEKLMLLYDERMTFFEKHQGVIRVIIQELSINPIIQKFFNELILPNMLKVLNQILEEGVNKEELKALPIHVMATGYIQLMMAPFTTSVMFKGVMDQQVHDHHRTLIQIYIDGIRRNPYV